VQQSLLSELPKKAIKAVYEEMKNAISQSEQGFKDPNVADLLMSAASRALSNPNLNLDFGSMDPKEFKTQISYLAVRVLGEVITETDTKTQNDCNILPPFRDKAGEVLTGLQQMQILSGDNQHEL
jgi:hypothetical protein